MTTQCNRCDTDTTGTSINLMHLDGSTESICTDCYRNIKVCGYDGDGFELDYERSPATTTTTKNPYSRRDGHRRQPGKNSQPWEAWQAGYEGQPLPPHPWPIAGIAQAGDPMDPTSVIGRCYKRGVDARKADADNPS